MRKLLGLPPWTAALYGVIVPPVLGVLLLLTGVVLLLTWPIMPLALWVLGDLERRAEGPRKSRGPARGGE